MVRELVVVLKPYDQYYSQIFGYVLKRVANIEIAQDIISKVLFKALKNLVLHCFARKWAVENTRWHL